MKQSGSILITPQPMQGYNDVKVTQWNRLWTHSDVSQLDNGYLRVGSFHVWRAQTVVPVHTVSKQVFGVRQPMSWRMTTCCCREIKHIVCTWIW